MFYDICKPLVKNLKVTMQEILEIVPVMTVSQWNFIAERFPETSCSVAIYTIKGYTDKCDKMGHVTCFG